MAILRLDIRKEEYKRDIRIRKTPKSLALFVWFGLLAILVYELLWVAALLLLNGIHRMGKKKNEEKNSIPLALHHQPPQARPHNIYHEERQHQTNQRQTTMCPSTRMRRPLLFMLVIFLWIVSTTYAAFYSFYMVFLYTNDNWYQLMPIQLALTLSDVYVWIWMIGRIKYSAWSAGTYWAKACLVIKSTHLVFNLLLEKDIWNMRHWLFCMEDVMSICMAREVFGVHLERIQKMTLLKVKGGILLVAVLLLNQTTSRVT